MYVHMHIMLLMIKVHTKDKILCFSVLLFTAVFDGFVRNFRIASKNTTHMTFTWDLESAYISHVTNYRIFYRESYPGASSYSYRTSYTATSSVSRIDSGETFTLTTTFNSFNSYSQYIMWLRVDINIAPSYLYSEQIYEEFGECIIIL